MPNYSLTIDSKFKPFEFKEMLEPVLYAQQAHQNIEDAYADISDKAEEVAGKINPLLESKTYERYKNYADALKEQSDLLATKGLNLTSRKAMLDLRNRYNKDITPINNVWERRRELSKEQRNLASADSSIRFDKDFSTMSLDDLIENPEMGYSSLSGNNISARAADMADQVAKAIISDPTYSKVLGGQYFQQRIQQGASIEDILKEVKGDSNALGILRKIRESIHGEIKDNSAYDKDWADQYITRGIYHAIGTNKYDLVKNGEYIDAESRRSLAQGDRRIALAEREFKANYEPDGKGGWKKKENLIPTDKEGVWYDPSTGTVRDKDNRIILNDKGGTKPGNSGTTMSKEDGLDNLALSPIFARRAVFSNNVERLPGTTEGGFDYDDMEIRKFEDMRLANQMKIRGWLKEYNLTPEDVDIYVDKDWYNDNHYMIVPKGYDTKTGKYLQIDTDSNSNSNSQNAISGGLLDSDFM